MPSWKTLQELGEQIATHLPGRWTCSSPPPHWMVVLEREDGRVRLLIDDSLGITLVRSLDERPLSPLGQIFATSDATPSTISQFKTRHRDARKIAALLAPRVR